MQLLLGIYFTKMENNNMMIKQTPLVSEITVTQKCEIWTVIHPKNLYPTFVSVIYATVDVKLQNYGKIVQVKVWT